MTTNPKLDERIEQERTEEVQVPAVAIDEDGCLVQRGTRIEQRIVREKVTHTRPVPHAVCRRHDFHLPDPRKRIVMCRGCPAGMLFHPATMTIKDGKIVAC